MSIAKTVLRNVASSWMGFGSQILLTLLLTPFVISKLGVEAYGVWLLLQSTLGYYGFVDMGLRAGLTQSITHRIAAKDYVGVSKHLGAAVPILSILGGVILLISLLVAVLLPRFVEMDPSIRHGLWLVILVQGLGSALQMPFAPVGAVLVGLQRYDIAEGIAVGTRITSGCLTWLVLTYGGGLLALAEIILVVNLVDSCVRLMIARRLLPAIRNTVFTLDRSELKELGAVGTWNFIIQISRQFIYFSSALLVGLMFSAKAVAPFGIAASIVDYGNRLVMISTRVLFPTMVHLGKGGNIALQKQLFITATRISVGVSLASMIVGYAWIDAFLRLWLGDEHNAQEIITQAPSIFLILGIAFAFVSMQRVGTQLLLARNEMAFLAVTMLVEACANLVIGVLCGWQLGPLGIAVGTLIPAVACTLFLHMPNHSRTLETPLPKLLFTILARPILFGTAISFAMAVLRYYAPGPQSWFDLILVGAVSASIVCLLLPILLSKPQVQTVSKHLLRGFARF